MSRAELSSGNKRHFVRVLFSFLQTARSTSLDGARGHKVGTGIDGPFFFPERFSPAVDAIGLSDGIVAQPSQAISTPSLPPAGKAHTHGRSHTRDTAAPLGCRLPFFIQFFLSRGVFESLTTQVSVVRVGKFRHRPDP